MRFNIKKISLLLSALAITTLTACSQNSENVKEDSTNDTIHKVKESTEQQSEKDSPLDLLNQLATFSKSTEEIYITGDLNIGEDQDINPGIYDLEITGGSGNIFGERTAVPSLFINRINTINIVAWLTANTINIIVISVKSTGQVFFHNSSPDQRSQTLF